MPIARIALSLVLLVVWGTVSSIYSRMLTQYQAIAAARVVNDDSVSGNALTAWFRAGDPFGWLLFLGLVVLLVLIWLPYLKKLFNDGMLSLLLIFLLAGCSTQRATTASETYGTADIVTVSPNQTAFVIPATGGNLSEQVKFDSQQYLESKKVPQKRITIDKDNIGQKYVPKTFVILVDRTQVARQWTKAPDTGTTAANQALCAESNESINVCFEISTAASITEEDASTYLYNYPTTKVADGQVGGVFVASPLGDVIDNQVRQYIQSKIGTESATRNLRAIIADKAKIVSDAETAAKANFKKQGITLYYVGLGGPLDLAPEVQRSIDALFIADQQVQIAKLHATVTAVNADAAKYAAITRGDGDAQALKKLSDALGGNVANLGSALEGYRWDGSRVLITGDKPGVAVTLPQPTATSTPVPAPPKPAPPATTPAATPKP